MSTYTVKHRGLKVLMSALNPDDHIAQKWARGSFYESGNGKLLDLLEQYRQEGMYQPGTYIDVGAHWGNHAVFMVGKALCTRCIAFEPNHDSAEACVENLRQNNLLNRTTVIEAGLSSQVSVGMVVDDEANNSGMSHLVNYASGGVPIMTLDMVHVHECAVIKIDVEGMERKVLLGGANFLDKHRPIVAVETLEFDKTDKLLAQMGYRFREQTSNGTPTYIYKHSRTW